MRLGSTTHLRRCSPTVFLSTVSTCGHSPLFLCSSLRGVYGGAGRGDLIFSNPEARRHSRRALGPLRGVRHGGQATAPESGQLHYRRLFLRAAGETPRVGSEQHRHAACTWAYLVPSLQRCAELCVQRTIWEKLCRLEGGCEVDVLSERELHSVRSGQNLFRYELHQRLPLLEDSVAHAELENLLGWFAAARRAWLQLPVSFFSSATHYTKGFDSTIIQTKSSFLPLRDLLSRSGTPLAVSRNITPCKQQVYDMPMRLAQLTKVVVDRTRDELGLFCDGVGDSNNRSARVIAKEKKFKQRFLDEQRWHGISN